MQSIFTFSQKASIKKLAIGSFDGFHLGHLELLRHLGENSALLIISKPKPSSLTPALKMQELSPYPLIFVDFETIKGLSGDIFLKSLKAEFVNLEEIIVGEDFCFGKDRAFKALDIEKLSGIKSCIVPEVKLNGIGVHSSFIKEFLSRGEIKKANAFLGRAYEIKGRLIKGQGIGKKELFATLNLEVQGYFLPKNGVYASFCLCKNKLFRSVSFIGIRSTDAHFSIETHILEDGFEKECLNDAEELRLIFKDFLRENQKFEKLEFLKTQIAKDRKQALVCLG